MATFDTGREAEAHAADYLQKRGYRVLQQNWRTRYCEIDLVAEKDKVAHFVEVKYRYHPTQGTGLDYITARKLQQMGFAAEMWVQNHRWQGEYCLSAIELTGPGFQVTNFLPNCV